MDALVIGAGITGAVIARQLAEKGQSVEIWDRRSHIAGNMYDHVDDYGIRVHDYGPHIFHTSDQEVYDYVKRFALWQQFKLECGAQILGKTVFTPFNFETIDSFYSKEEGNRLKKKLNERYGHDSVSVLDVMNDKDPDISGYGKFLFEHDYSLYTAKQWGVSPDEIDPSVLTRVKINMNYGRGYFSDKWQMMPEKGYTCFIESILNHPNIHVRLNVDALDHLMVQGNQILLDGNLLEKPLIYTGALDELFHCSEGPLPYRSLRFEWFHIEQNSYQEMPVVAYPEAKGYTRITEYKKLPVQNVKGTTCAKEYSLVYQPDKKQEPYYPIPSASTTAAYQKYALLAERIPNLYPCGRLADYRYYNMDQALKRALDYSLKIITN